MTLASKSGGRLIAVVGPSGVGKDSVMAGLHSAIPDLHLVRRVITRAPDLGGEDYDAVSVSQFEALVEDAAFALHWRAHGLHYGIPITVKYQLGKGTDCLVNFSRKALTQAAEIFPRFVVLNITAKPETLAHRLAARADKPLPAVLKVINLANDGPLSQTIARGAALLQPVSL
jgi:ribose 1,5-bisphosphokinase